MLLPILFHVLGVLVPPITGNAGNSGPFKRFEYTYSFKGPYLAQPDGSIPFWERRGNALPHDSNIRITPSLRNQRGAVWTKNPAPFPDWEVELVFRISGRGKFGGEGLGFWYVAEKPEAGQCGSVFGGFNGPWKGLAIFWDSYDDDGAANNPALVGIMNDGSKIYEHDKDGHPQQFGSHKKDYRNQRFYARARITYHRSVLSVYMSNGRTREASDSELEPMFFSWGLNLTHPGYFGVTAATGSVVSDDHDVAKFMVYSLHDTSPKLGGGGQGQGQAGAGSGPRLQEFDTEDEAEKYKKEFLEWQDKLDKQRAEYKAEHPTPAQGSQDDLHDPEDDTDPNDEYLLEIRKVFIEQALARQDLTTISKGLDEVLGKHESMTSAIVRFYHKIPEDYIVPGVALPSPPPSEVPIPQRFEVENLLTGNRELLGVTAEIKKLVRELADSGGKSQNHGVPPEFGGPTVSEEMAEVIREVAGLSSGIRLINSRMEEVGGDGGCAWSCISTKSFVLLNICFTAVFLAVIMYKEGQGQGQGQGQGSVGNGNKQRFY